MREMLDQGRLVLAVCGVVFAAVSVLSFLAQTVEAARPGCKPITVIGVRGSTEPSGLGGQIKPFVQSLRGHLSGTFRKREVRVIALDYPARNPLGLVVPWIDQDRSVRNRYETSVNDGKRELVRVLRNLRRSKCLGRTRIVLAGYSQGAQVIHDSIVEGRLAFARKRIAATTFFGDPRFDQSQPHQRKIGNFEANDQGVVSATFDSTRRVTATLKGFHVDTFCLADDPICGADLRMIVNRDWGNHSRYREYLTDVGAMLAKVKLDRYFPLRRPIEKKRRVKVFTAEGPATFRVKPRLFRYTGDGTGFVGGKHTNPLRPGKGGIKWTIWNQKRAVGKAWIWINNCSPSCAEGSFYRNPGKVFLSRPKNGKFYRLKLVFRRGNKRTSAVLGLRRIGGTDGYYAWYIIRSTNF